MQVLCIENRKKFYWEPVNWKLVSDKILKTALVAGYQKDISSYLYVGRVKQPNLYKIGKVIPPKKDGAGLWIWQGEQPLHFTRFQLLKIAAKR